MRNLYATMFTALRIIWKKIAHVVMRISTITIVFYSVLLKLLLRLIKFYRAFYQI